MNPHAATEVGGARNNGAGGSRSASSTSAAGPSSLPRRRFRGADDPGRRIRRPPIGGVRLANVRSVYSLPLISLRLSNPWPPSWERSLECNTSVTIWTNFSGTNGF